jgi:hypothetical protein
MTATHDESRGDRSEFQEWLSSEGGQHPIKASDTVRAALAEVDLAIDRRSFLWPDGHARTFDESVAHLHREEPQVGLEDAANLVMDWLEDPERVEESASQEVSAERLHELRQMLDEWILELDQTRASS